MGFLDLDVEMDGKKVSENETDGVTYLSLWNEYQELEKLKKGIEKRMKVMAKASMASGKAPDGFEIVKKKSIVFKPKCKVEDKIKFYTDVGITMDVMMLHHSKLNPLCDKYYEKITKKNLTESSMGDIVKFEESQNVFSVEEKEELKRKKK